MIVFLELTAVLPTMAACWKYMDRVIKEKKDRTVLYLFFVMITMVYGISVRFYQGAYPEDLFGAAVLKFCASLPSVILGLKGYLMEKNRFDLLIVIALITGLLADVSINLNMIAGATLFGIGHLLYDSHSFFLSGLIETLHEELAVRTPGSGDDEDPVPLLIDAPQQFRYGRSFKSVFCASDPLISRHVDRKGLWDKVRRGRRRTGGEEEKRQQNDQFLYHRFF